VTASASPGRRGEDLLSESVGDFQQFGDERFGGVVGFGV
jgi:hypothetical protein